MRGKHTLLSNIRNGVRITPAHAGKTAKQSKNKQFAEDHPRACGENILTMHPNIYGIGSPPRMRGKLTFTCVSTDKIRITPAHAGKTIYRKP